MAVKMIQLSDDFLFLYLLKTQTVGTRKGASNECASNRVPTIYAKSQNEKNIYGMPRECRDKITQPIQSTTEEEEEPSQKRNYILIAST